LEYLNPCTWLDVAFFCCAKDDEGNKGEATAAAEDVIQGNKDQATIEIVGNYDSAYPEVAASYNAG
jgi:hypothetical protein